MQNLLSDLPQLRKKRHVDKVIRETRNLVVALRFGREDDVGTLELDHMLSKSKEELSRMVLIYTVDVDDVPIYVQYFDIAFVPSIVFFFNGRHIKIDFGLEDNTKFVGTFKRRQDLIDLVEVIYTGGIRNKFIVASPIPKERLQRYSILYGDM